MDTKNNEEGRFEKILENVGSAGRYQQLLLWVFLAPISFISIWIPLAPILLTSTPDHWCDVPGRPGYISQEAWVNWTVPRDVSGSLSKCLQYNMSQASVPGLVDDTVADRQTIPCQHGFSYSTVDYDETLTTRHDWVCDNSGMVANWQSVGFAGCAFGSFLFNTLSDIAGRRNLFVVCGVTYGVMGVVRMYVTPLWLMMLTQFLASSVFPSVLDISFILVIELTSDSWRSRVTSISSILWSLGACGLGLVAYFAKSDRILSWIISMPFLVALPAMWILPESPRWLLTRGRVKEATAQLETVARVNGRDRPPDLDDRLKEIALEKQPNYGIIQLLQTKTLRKRTTILTLCCSFNFIVDFSLAYNSSSLASSDFINFFMLGITQVLSNFAGWWMSMNIGRRWSSSLAYLLTSAVLAVILMVGAHQPVWVNILLLSLSRFFIIISYMIMFLQMAELYPTTHCGTGMGVASVVSTAFTTTVPYIIYSSNKWWGLPYVILFALCLCGFIVSSFIVETLGSSLPQSLDEAENFLVGVPYWSYRGRKFWKRSMHLNTDYQTEIEKSKQIESRADHGADTLIESNNKLSSDHHGSSYGLLAVSGNYSGKPAS